jgi:hypothetical protein
MKHITYLESIDIHERINKVQEGLYQIPDDPEKHEQALIVWDKDHPIRTNLDARKALIANLSAQNYATFMKIGGSAYDHDIDVNWLEAPADE